MKLSKKLSVPNTNLGSYITLLYGQEKIGKTTFASMFPSPYFMFFEPGGKDLSVYKSDVEDWGDFRKLIIELKDDTRFKTVVIDTADLAYEQCDRWVCAKNGIMDPGDLDYGKGWREVRKEFAGQIVKLARTGKGIIFISHAQDKTFRTRLGSEVNRIVPTMSKQAREVLEPLVDIWAYYRYDVGGSREIVIRGTDEVSAGCRLKNHFYGIDKIRGGRSELEAYENFVSGFESNRGSEFLEKETRPKSFKLKK